MSATGAALLIINKLLINDWTRQFLISCQVLNGNTKTD